MGEAKLTVISVSELTGIDAIDGGHTVVVRFKRPDDGEVALLVPQSIAADLTAYLAQGGELAAGQRPAALLGVDALQGRTRPAQDPSAR